jgi:HAE1 family hydrophobic/amphiphilic exporter-1
MLVGTVIGILVIPSLFIIFQNLQEKISKKKLPVLEETNEI